MATLKNDKIQISTLFESIKEGQVKIPAFQREFVWSMDKSIDLLDSMIKGYPIGNFIFWETREELRSVGKIGDQIFENSKDKSTSYILDGQQRITTLYAVYKGLKVGRSDYSRIYVDLEAKEDEPIVIMADLKDERDTLVPLTKLIELKASTLKEKEAFQEKITAYWKKLSPYELSVTTLTGASIDVATDVFTRLNTGGKALSTFEIMVAKTYDAKKKFDLGEKYKTFYEELENIDFVIPSSVVLQTVSIFLKRECRKEVILRLEKDAFIEIWDKAIDAIKLAIDFLRTGGGLNVPSSALLPYGILIVPLSYFFSVVKEPSSRQSQLLVDFFWRASLTQRYSGSIDSNIAEDIKRIDKIIQEKHPDYDLWELYVEPEDIRKRGDFSLGSSYTKAIILILAGQNPRSFKNNKEVVLRSDWLKQSNSKNYHHIFPKSFMKKNRPKVDEKLINNVLNFSIVDDYLNKNEIRDKAPSDYFKEYQNKNQKLEETLKSHLIGSLESFGLLRDDYELFLQKRAEEFSKEIKGRLI